MRKEGGGEDVVGDGGLAEEAVEGAPVMVGHAQGNEGLGNGAPSEGEEMSEDEGLHPSKSALLAEGGTMRLQQAPQGGEEGGWRDGRGGDMLGQVFVLLEYGASRRRGRGSLPARGQGAGKAL